MALVTDRSGFPKSGLALQLYRVFGGSALAGWAAFALTGMSAFPLLSGDKRTSGEPAKKSLE